MNTRSISILALGDSYTIGEDVPERERWVVQLAEDLKENKKIFIDQLEIIARTGWTTGELIQAMKEKKVQGKWDLIFLLIGVNNQYRGYSLEEYRQEFIELLNLSLNLSQSHQSLYVLSIPDWGNTRFAEGKDKDKIAREIDLFNKINLEESQRKSISYINITPISRIHPLPTAMLASDGLHPSGVMYSLWKKEVMKVISI